ncbi:MAG: transposase [Bacteroidales bacterium]|nr:transposase [Bacteroidales bacterium]
MSTKVRSFYSDILIHCYQRMKDGYLQFYNFIDYLVYFSILCTLAPRFGIKILSLCQMPDHTHGAFKAYRSKDLAKCMGELSRYYSRYGQAYPCRGGRLFTCRYGSAVKYGDKKARTNFIYIGNNPVERRLVQKAEEYRWNYLAYAVSDHPFSEKLVVRKASYAMKQAMAEVKSTHDMDRPLSYILLRRLFKPLNGKEQNQLIDYIITTYSVIDYAAAIRFFDSYQDMIGAMHYNTGSEYDINEVFTGRSDACYAEIANWLTVNLRLKDIHDVFLMPDEKRTNLLFDIHKATGAPPAQIAKFLRLLLKTEP